MSSDKDLGFVFTIHKNGGLAIHRKGVVVTDIRAKNAASVVIKLLQGTFSKGQQLMAN